MISALHIFIGQIQILEASLAVRVVVCGDDFLRQLGECFIEVVAIIGQTVRQQLIVVANRLAHGSRQV